MSVIRTSMYEKSKGRFYLCWHLGTLSPAHLLRICSQHVDRTASSVTYSVMVLLRLIRINVELGVLGNRLALSLNEFWGLRSRHWWIHKQHVRISHSAADITPSIFHSRYCVQIHQLNYIDSAVTEYSQQVQTPMKNCIYLLEKVSAFSHLSIKNTDSLWSLKIIGLGSYACIDSISDHTTFNFSPYRQMWGARNKNEHRVQQLLISTSVVVS